MKLVTKEQLFLVVQSLKTLIDQVKKQFLTEEDALEILLEMNYIEPLADANGSIYTAPDGVIYTL